MDQETNTTPIRKLVKDDAINIMALVKTVWNGRRRIIKTTLIFMVIGLFVAVFTPKQYTASTTIVPSKPGKSSGSLNGLAALAGINLSGGGSEISPNLYPEIISSIPFRKELLQTLLSFEDQKSPISYENYYTNYHSPGVLSTVKKYTVGLPGLLISTFKTSPVSSTQNKNTDSKLLIVSDKERGLIGNLTGQLSLSVHEKDGFVSLSVNMPEPLPAAQLTQKFRELLQDYIIRFKVQKSTEELKFITERFKEKEKEFKSIQQDLAHYRDSNKNLSSAMSQTHLEALTSQYRLALSVYSELAKQLESQQLQVKKDTPVFTILKPVSVPANKSYPNRPLILLTWILLGVFLSAGMVLGKPAFEIMKQKFNSEI